MTRLDAPVCRRNAETWLSLEDTAERNWRQAPFRKTYDYPGDWIDPYHRSLAEAPLLPDGDFLDLGITGWLLRADALKLYELAYFAQDVLELGTCCGLSASVIARAVHNSGRPRAFATVDLDPTIQDAARWSLDQQATPGREAVQYFRREGAQFLRDLIERGEPRRRSWMDALLRRPAPSGFDVLPRRYSLVFVDHAHTYDAVTQVCALLHEVVEPGGFALFHDYNDPRNILPDVDDYGVYQAVGDALRREHFDFYGVFGCAGLFRRTSEQPFSGPDR